MLQTSPSAVNAVRPTRGSWFFGLIERLSKPQSKGCVGYFDKVQESTWGPGLRSGCSSAGVLNIVSICVVDLWILGFRWALCEESALWHSARPHH